MNFCRGRWSAAEAAQLICVGAELPRALAGASLRRRLNQWLDEEDDMSRPPLERHGQAVTTRLLCFRKALVDAGLKGDTSLHPMSWAWFAFKKARRAVSPWFMEQIASWELTCWRGGKVPLFRVEAWRRVEPNGEHTHHGVTPMALMLRPFDLVAAQRLIQSPGRVLFEGASTNGQRRAKSAASPRCEQLLRDGLRELVRSRVGVEAPRAKGGLFSAPALNRHQVLRLLEQTRSFAELDAYAASTQLRALSQVARCREGRAPEALRG